MQEMESYRETLSLENMGSSKTEQFVQSQPILGFPLCVDITDPAGDIGSIT